MTFRLWRCFSLNRFITLLITLHIVMKNYVCYKSCKNAKFSFQSTLKNDAKLIKNVFQDWHHMVPLRRPELWNEVWLLDLHWIQGAYIYLSKICSRVRYFSTCYDNNENKKNKHSYEKIILDGPYITKHLINKYKQLSTWVIHLATNRHIFLKTFFGGFCTFSSFLAEFDAELRGWRGY